MCGSSQGAEQRAEMLLPLPPLQPVHGGLHLPSARSPGLESLQRRLLLQQLKCRCVLTLKVDSFVQCLMPVLANDHS